MNDPAVLLAGASFITTVGLWIYTWLREGRMRRWAEEDAAKTAARAEEAAKKIAAKATEDAITLAAKVNADAIALAAKGYREAADMAKKVIDDAEKIAIKVHESAERMTAKVAENTAVSTEAAKGASTAFSEANQINRKIASLQESLLKVTDHIEKSRLLLADSTRVAHEEAQFNLRVQKAIDEKLEQMNGRSNFNKRKK